MRDIFQVIHGTILDNFYKKHTMPSNMSRWISSAEIRIDSVMRQSVSTAANSYIGAVAKREAAILSKRVGELFGVRNRRYDSHKGSRLIFVNFGTRRTRKAR